MEIKDLKPGVFEAVEAMFDMNDAIVKNNLSIGDLMEGLALAIDGPRQGDDGHFVAMVSMMMMAEALRRDSKVMEDANA